MIDETWEKPPSPKMKNRPCLKCDALFFTSNMIRICQRCKRSREWKEEAGVHIYALALGRGKMMTTASLIGKRGE